MTFTSFASSSKGNAYLVTDGATRILLECGIARRTLQKALGFTLSGIDGVLVSHEHKDHCRCARELVKDGLRIYMSRGTAEAIFPESEEPPISAIEAGKQVRIGTIDVMPFKTFHDAAEPLGYVLRSAIDGDVLVWATDTVNLRYTFPGVNLLAIEANYDLALLERSDKLPDKTKKRITNTHMELGTLLDILRGMDLSQCKHIYLLHLSAAMSREQYFAEKVRRAAGRGIPVTVCPQ